MCMKGIAFIEGLKWLSYCIAFSFCHINNRTIMCYESYFTSWMLYPNDIVSSFLLLIMMGLCNVMVYDLCDVVFSPPDEARKHEKVAICHFFRLRLAGENGEEAKFKLRTVHLPECFLWHRYLNWFPSYWLTVRQISVDNCGAHGQIENSKHCICFKVISDSHVWNRKVLLSLVHFFKVWNG